MKFFIVEILDMLVLVLFFIVLNYLKKNGEFDKYILVSYIIIFKNSLIFFYLFKDKLGYIFFCIFRLILLVFGAFCLYFLDILNYEIIDYLLIITPIIFLIYLIVKKDISNKGIKLILLVFYEVLLIYLSLEIIIAIGYQ
ncbi:hypothetical protein LDK15_08350 [Fusobacterium nucleatum]|uniref:hypothetical protein n=1 Tax=Fusobacterium nucleatum TaxID=851 RepID=UPI0030D4F45C